MQKDVLVIGGGIAGLQAALELAGAGYPVHLITDEANLGGKLVDSSEKKDDTPCVWGQQVNISALYLGGNLHASSTVLGSLITRVYNTALIHVATGVKLVEFSGEIGRFQATISDVATGKRLRKLSVGAVILATGFSMYDVSKKGEFGYSYYKNVVTSLEYEHMLSQNRHKVAPIRRPSDGKPAEKIAFIQCVGSRDVVSKGEYCSAICCMFTAKEAILTKEYAPKTDVTVFYLDLRSCGKNFDTFYNRAKELGTRYVRTMISEVKEDPSTEKLSINYAAATKPIKEQFDLVVLAAGIRPSTRLAETAEILNVSLNQFGFVDVDALDPVITSQPGIFSVGGNQGPLDVPETMALSSAACAATTKVLGRPDRPVKKPTPERDISKEPLRVGVFFCQSALATMGANADTVLNEIKKQPNIAIAECQQSLCTPESIGKIQKMISQQGLNRLVFSPCIFKHNLGFFQDAAQAGGLNRMLVEMPTIPNINWDENKDKANDTAISFTKKAISNVKDYKPLCWHAEPVVARALIVGGGITGMSAAVALADRGFSSTLVEKNETLGGYTKTLKGTPEFDKIRITTEDLERQVKKNDKIEVLTHAKIKSFTGRQGNFISTLAIEGQNDKQVEHGAVILATGTTTHQTSEYLYGKNSRVITGNTALSLLAGADIPTRSSSEVTYVYIQCVGSRNKENAYCSRSCCLETVHSASRMKKINPDAQVYVLSRDIRTPGYLELKYKEARKLGVVFIHYEEDNKPDLTEKSDGSLTLKVVDSASGKTITLQPDHVILASAQKATDDSQELAQLLKIQINSAGFLSETHANFGSIAFPGGGIFIAGAAHEPKGVAECLVQAKGVAGRVGRILSQPVLMMGGVVAEVEWEKCAACLTCVRTCPYTIPQITREKKEMGAAYIPPADCRGCGMCASECPNKAIFLHHYQDDDVLARVECALAEVGS